MRVEMKSERGQALPLLMVVLGIALVAMISVVHISGRAAVVARAQTAADAAALAGAASGRPGAADLAAANGADLDVFVVDGAHVQVVVSIGEVTAEARAVRRSEWVP